jgi:nucleoside-diphosphate-sugar epimerase
MADKPLVLITGAAGNLGHSLAKALGKSYAIVGLDTSTWDLEFPIIEVDLTDDAKVDEALAQLRREHGNRIASVLHLAAFFDFSGEDKPLYEAVNVEGSRRLVRGLADFEVEQFIYSGTMLVHAPGEPGDRIDESAPIDPQWAYPRSKAAAEQAIRDTCDGMPLVLLHVAGVYDEQSSVPTFANQIARIYERDFQSHFYSGDTRAGQAMVHRDDLIDAFVRTVDRRASLPGETTILIGEEETLGYADLQDRLGCLIHGQDEWATIRLPTTAAAAGAWLQDKAEPLVPDAIDHGERPFIQPFMTVMASHHYALDTRKARELLGWKPRHRLSDELPAMIATLKDDPAAWYETNRVTPPAFVSEAEAAGQDPEALRLEYETRRRADHKATRWAHFANIALGLWILTQPIIVQVREPALFWSEITLGGALILFASLSLSWRMTWARWASAGVGALLLAIPFLFWTGNPAAFLSDTLVGMLVFSFAVGALPEPGPSISATMDRTTIPAGWSYNPSSWTQRLPIIVLALIGLIVARYLTAYQLGQVDGVWEPFFPGLADDPSKNGTEAVITSAVSEAFPIPDAALGGYTYALEIVTGIVGSRARWRTMPWLVFLFGLMIVPLSIVSISFVIIQPIVIGTWATLTLVAAAAMLIQVPYAVDELVATLQFVHRRAKTGQSWLRVFLFGDADKAGRIDDRDEFDRAPGAIARDMFAGGVNLPWNLAAAALIGGSLLFTRLTLGAEGSMADADHAMGFVILTVVSLAAAEIVRITRYLLVPCGIAVALSPLLVGADTPHLIANILAGGAVAVLALRRGPISERYGGLMR